MEQRVTYQTFRQAIFERDASAWVEIVHYCRPLMIVWANRFRATLDIGEFSEDIADEAFARASVALTPHRFAAFPSVGSLMAYLRRCVKATVIDYARAARTRARQQQALVESEQSATPEQIVNEEMTKLELWQLINSLIGSDLERIVFTESFVYSLPPREIIARHPAMFADVAAVYCMKRNLTERLQRNPMLRQRFEELLS